jgi:tRNA threonylcarbamoyladenosine biosynthesis protein TsaB
VVALGRRDGRLVAEERWTSEHRHGSELLGHLDGLFAAAGTTLADIGAVVVGIGPGSFTGLRVGLATVKVIAYIRRIPVAAVSSLAAIAHGALGGRDGSATAGAVPSRVAVALPAGSTDCYLALVERGRDGLPVQVGAPRLVAGAGSLAAAAGEGVLVAVDLDGADAGSGDAAVARGHAALAQLANGLLTIGTERLRAGSTIEIAELVPAYVALPRGVAETMSGMAWSPDLR